MNLNKIKDLSGLLHNNSLILDYLESNEIDSVSVVINEGLENEFSFDLKDLILKQSMRGLRKQLKNRINQLRNNLLSTFNI